MDLLLDIGPMAIDDSAAVSKHLRILFGAGTVAGMSDGELLNRFTGGRDAAAEAAFAALVERHGPMVLRVCRGVLNDPHDAEDAVQATFLVLALRPGAVRNHDSLASWLFGVARHAATKAKVAAGRRRVRERRGAELADRRDAEDRSEGWSELHEEVDRLSEKYRDPIVLCYLEGLTHQEAADRLRLPLGTVKVRLSRARDRLRSRLARRGLAPAVLAGASTGVTAGAIPAPLVEATARAAVRAEAGRALGVSDSIATLVKGVLQTMLLTKLKTTAALLAASLTLFLATAFVTSVAPRPARSIEAPVLASAREGPATKPERPAAGDGPGEIAVEVLKPSDLTLRSAQVGTVHAFELVELYPKISGYLKSMKVDIGDVVKRGQVIAEIDVPELNAELSRDMAAVAQAKAGAARVRSALEAAAQTLVIKRAEAESATADVKRAEAAHAYRRKELDRYRDLFKRNAVPELTLAGAEERVETTAADKTAAESKVTLSKAEVAKAAAELDAAREAEREAEAGSMVAESIMRKTKILAGHARIVSPLDGTVTRRNYSEGAFLRSGDSGVGLPLVTIERTDKVRVVVNIPDREVPFTDVGDRAIVRLDAYPGVQFVGKVSRFSGAEEAASRTMRTEIDLDNPERRLRPGQYGVVTIDLVDRPAALTIPIRAVIDWKGTEAACYRVVDGRAVRTRIRTGIDNGTRVEVLAGLNEGDSVVAGPGPTLKEGQSVRAGTHEPAGGKP